MLNTEDRAAVDGAAEGDKRVVNLFVAESEAERHFNYSPMRPSLTQIRFDVGFESPVRLDDGSAQGDSCATRKTASRYCPQHNGLVSENILAGDRRHTLNPLQCSDGNRHGTPMKPAQIRYTEHKRCAGIIGSVLQTDLQRSQAESFCSRDDLP